jgi:chromosome segregation ATPase
VIRKLSGRALLKNISAGHRYKWEKNMSDLSINKTISNVRAQAEVLRARLLSLSPSRVTQLSIRALRGVSVEPAVVKDLAREVGPYFLGITDICEPQGELDQLLDEVKTIEEAIAELQSQYAALLWAEGLPRDIQAKLTEAGANVTRLSEELDQVRTVLIAATTAQREAEEKAGSAQHEAEQTVASAKEEAKNMELAIAEQLAALQQRAEEAEAEVQRLETHRTPAPSVAPDPAIIAEYEQRVTTAEQGRQEAQASLDEVLKHKEELQARIGTLEGRVETITLDLQRANKREKDLVDESIKRGKQHTEQYTKLQTGMQKKADAAVGKAQAELESLRGERATIDAESESAHQAAEAAEQRAERAEQRAERAEQRATELKAELKQVEQSRETIGQEVSLLNRERDSRRSEFEHIQSKLIEVQADRDQTASERNEERLAASKTTVDVITARVDISHLKIRKAELEEQVAALEGDLTNNAQLLKEARQATEAARETARAEVATELEQARTALAEQTTLAKQAQAEVESLRQKLVAPVPSAAPDPAQMVDIQALIENELFGALSGAPAPSIAPDPAEVTSRFQADIRQLTDDLSAAHGTIAQQTADVTQAKASLAEQTALTKQELDAVRWQIAQLEALLRGGPSSAYISDVEVEKWFTQLRDGFPALSSDQLQELPSVLERFPIIGKLLADEVQQVLEGKDTADPVTVKDVIIAIQTQLYIMSLQGIPMSLIAYLAFLPAMPTT